MDAQLPKLRQSSAGLPRAFELLEDIADGVALTGPGGELRFLSKRLAHSLGIDAISPKPTSLFTLLRGISTDILPTLHDRAYATGAAEHTAVRGVFREFLARVVIRVSAFDGERCVIWTFDAAHGQVPILTTGHACLELAAKRADFGFWDMVIATDEVTWWNDWCDQYDIDACAGRDHSARWDAGVHPDDVGQTGTFYEVVSGERELYEAEFRVRTRSGSWRWVLSRGMATMRDPSGRALRITGITMDIDARKRAEKALRESEARLAMILQTMSEGVVLIDADGRVEFTNPAFDRMFGHEPGAVNGKVVMELLDLRHHAKVSSRAIDRLLARFSATDGKRTVTFRRRNGTEFPGDVLSGTIEVAGIKKTVYVIRDVIERKLLEKEITEIAHRERRRIGGDLHDGLGQELTGISLLLRSLARRIESNQLPQRSDLDEIIALVNHAIQTTRSMAMGLSPVTLERGGVVSALSSLAAWTRSTLGCEVRLRRALRHKLTLDEANATHLYLIAQEAILNAVKHGRARLILVTLSTTHDVISLAISDDGIGLRSPGRLNPGMGLKIMEYRAGMMGGSLSIKKRNGGGTRVHCVCPRSALERSG